MSLVSAWNIIDSGCGPVTSLYERENQLDSRESSDFMGVVYFTTVVDAGLREGPRFPTFLGDVKKKSKGHLNRKSSLKSYSHGIVGCIPSAVNLSGKSS